ncbi:MAG: hypothetical protein JSW70_04710 [Syntrophobacterales bacterium]|nr:MAG: hypothetical protein JSW70_04710 [Syntrophobacterales bacterium]
MDKREYRETTEYHTCVVNNTPYYSYTSIGNFTEPDMYKPGGEHRWEVTTYTNGMPSTIAFQIDKNTVKWEFNGKGTVDMRANWEGRTFKRSRTFKPNVTVENTLFLRTLNFSQKEKYVFDLLQIREMPDLEAYEMFFKALGEEKVTVKAGTFTCKKILFSLTGFKGLFYKAYYYVTHDEHRYIIKIDNIPRGGTSELVRIE